MWERSCSVQDLKYQVSLPNLSFRDDMLGSSATRSREIAMGPCGDRKLYDKAKGTYEALAAISAPISSHAVLLAYNPETLDEAVALSAETLLSTPDGGMDKIQAVNNHGIVMALAGENSDAERMFVIAASATRRYLEGTLRNKSGQSEYMKQQALYQKISSRNSGRLFEAFFNLGSLYYRNSVKPGDVAAKSADSIWTEYVTKFDGTSEWSKFALSRLTDKPDPSRIQNIATVMKGKNEKDVKALWGNPGIIVPQQNESFWIYSNRGVNLRMKEGKVVSLTTMKALNQSWTGMQSKTIKLKLGEPFSFSAREMRYRGLTLFLDSKGKVEGFQEY
jgi:hypothetical protein